MSQEKIAVVTGASSGMGKLTAIRLAEKGYKVAALDVSKDALDELEKEVTKITSFVCDISNGKQVEDTLKSVEVKLGPVDRLVNAAAIMPLGGLNDMSIDLIIKMMRINYEGTVYLTKYLVPKMVERKSGEVILFGSVAGDIPLPASGAYSASKAAVNTYVNHLSHENRNNVIKILLVSPHVVNTPLLDTSKTGMAITMGGGNSKPSAMDKLVAQPEFILDCIDKALVKNQSEIHPGIFPKVSILIYKLFPKLYWKFVSDATDKMITISNKIKAKQKKSDTSKVNESVESN